MYGNLKKIKDEKKLIYNKYITKNYNTLCKVILNLYKLIFVNLVNKFVFVQRR